MEMSSAFIGGSVALLAVLAKVNRFTPQDLDIYVPEAYTESLARHILSGFKAIGGHSPIYHLNPAIAHVEWYSSISHPLIHINIIMTQSRTPFGGFIPFWHIHYYECYYRLRHFYRLR